MVYYSFIHQRYWRRNIFKDTFSRDMKLCNCLHPRPPPIPNPSQNIIPPRLDLHHACYRCCVLFFQQMAPKIILRKCVISRNITCLTFQGALQSESRYGHAQSRPHARSGAELAPNNRLMTDGRSRLPASHIASHCPDSLFLLGYIIRLIITTLGYYYAEW